MTARVKGKQEVLSPFRNFYDRVPFSLIPPLPKPCFLRAKRMLKSQFSVEPCFYLRNAVTTRRTVAKSCSGLVSSATPAAFPVKTPENRCWGYCHRGGGRAPSRRCRRRRYRRCPRGYRKPQGREVVIPSRYHSCRHRCYQVLPSHIRHYRSHHYRRCRCRHHRSYRHRRYRRHRHRCCRRRCPRGSSRKRRIALPESWVVGPGPRGRRCSAGSDEGRDCTQRRGCGGGAAAVDGGTVVYMS